MMRHLFFPKGIEDVTFKHTGGHDLAYYPYGILGAGYIVTEAEKGKIRTLTRKYFSLTTAAILIGILFLIFLLPRTGIVLGWLIAGSLVVVPGIYFHMGMRRLLASAPKTSERLHIGETQRNLARTISWVQLVVGMLMTMPLAAMGILILWAGIEKGSFWGGSMGLACTLFFGASLAFSCRITWLKWGKPKRA